MATKWVVQLAIVDTGGATKPIRLPSRSPYRAELQPLRLIWLLFRHASA